MINLIFDLNPLPPLLKKVSWAPGM